MSIHVGRARKYFRVGPRRRKAPHIENQTRDKEQEVLPRRNVPQIHERTTEKKKEVVLGNFKLLTTKESETVSPLPTAEKTIEQYIVGVGANSITGQLSGQFGKQKNQERYYGTS